jgi:hypothetical protein
MRDGDSHQVDQADEGGSSKGDAEQRAAAAEQVDGDRHGERESGVNRRSWKADDAPAERGHCEDAQNASGQPSGEVCDQGRLLQRAEE